MEANGTIEMTIVINCTKQIPNGPLLMGLVQSAKSEAHVMLEKCNIQLERAPVLNAQGGSVITLSFAPPTVQAASLMPNLLKPGNS